MARKQHFGRAVLPRQAAVAAWLCAASCAPVASFVTPHGALGLGAQRSLRPASLLRQPAAALEMAVDCEAAFTRRESLRRAAALIIAAPTVLRPAVSHAEPALMDAAPLKSSPSEAPVGGAAIMPAEGVFCDQAVSRLVNAETKQEVYIVGTAHISKLSAELVRDTIRLVHPDRVMIELDSKRIKKRLPSSSNAASESNLPEKSQPSSVWGLIKAGKGCGGA
jgi:hypothetical protein